MAEMRHLQNQLFRVIDRHHFNFQLPTLEKSTWDIIVNDSDERERLEFTGDAYMNATVGQHLYRVFPEGTPFLYTISRNALTANATFAHIMDRLGFANPCLSTKASGDAFESIIGAKKKEDPASLDRWFQIYYLPLLKLTADVCRSLPRKGKAPKPRTLLTSIRLRSLAYGSPAKQRRQGFSSPSSLRKHRITAKMRLLTSPSPRLRRTIDLTFDSDWEDDNSQNDIVQISFEEFSKARASTTKCSSAATILGDSTNPIVVD